MWQLNALFLLLLSIAPDGLAAPAQEPMNAPATTRPRRKVQGRFLHITDMHPDPHYRVDASEKSACHRRKPKKAKRRSGYYGMSYSDCDSPFSLTNYTLDWLDRKWSSEIDFVIWTGDSARHDNDRKMPRTTAEIYDLNRALSKKMEDIFVKQGIPVIPSIGNNDVWPHNIMMPGPNSITSEFSSIWRAFVPFESYQVFQRGGYYSVEVIPNSVAVISLNTMYFYDSNKAVGGCEYSEPEDPGNLQFDWMEVQLHNFRQRGMQVWISGHVPPSSDNFFPECHVRYVELSLRYQDTILGHLYGHMNADHFFFIEADDLAGTNPSEDSDGINDEPDGLKRKHRELYDSLLKDFAGLPKTSQNINHDNYGVVNVAPSVVPNPYLPSFRIFVYNATGTAYTPGDVGHRTQLELQAEENDRPGNYLSDSVAPLCGEPPYRDSWRCKLDQPWHSNHSSPSRVNRLWSPLGYAQYWLPTLDESDEKHPPKYKLEYTTFPVSRLHPPGDQDMKPRFQYPIPLRHLPRSLRNATATSSKYAPYELEDLTIPSWTELAQRLAKAKGKKLGKRFRKFMYMGADEGK